jgi:hypothetical protein
VALPAGHGQPGARMPGYAMPGRAVAPEEQVWSSIMDPAADANLPGDQQ